MISETLIKISNEYIEQKNIAFANNELASFIRKSAKNIKSELSEYSETFLFKASPGQMNTWADVPWIAILDPEVTESTQNGYYVVYLFSVDMKKVYLSLNQGITFLHKELKEKKSIEELKRRAAFIRDRIPEYQDYFKFFPIDLSSDLSKSHRPRLYEPGHAFGVEYDTSSIPSNDILINDLTKILELYLLLTHRGGLDGDLVGIDDEPENLAEQDLNERKRYFRHRRIERNPKTSSLVKKHRGYICEACEFSFVKVYGDIAYNKKKEAYIEAHHLTPISDLPEGKTIKYNVEEDFRVLCANCHKMVHRKNPPYSIEELRKILKKPS
jgi:5-methylcytosine-specific restriction enzyme A